VKAFLLAGGLGTRLRPLTDTVPKCLVPIAGRPLLSYWFSLLERDGFAEVLVNLHHLPQQVREYVGSVSSPLRVTLFDEPRLLGSAGTVRANREWVADGDPFLIAYADNLTDADLSGLMAAHRQHGQLLTMALFRADEPTRCGIAEIAGGGESGTIVGFEEKPSRPKSNLANAGLYVSDVRIVDRIPPRTPADFGQDVLPAIVGEMHGHVLRERLVDVGTWESYERAQREALQLNVSERDRETREANR
jgi:mannose-1-phosphate guanylyltransferase